MNFRSFLTGTAFGMFLIIAVLAGAVTDRLVGFDFLDQAFDQLGISSQSLRINPPPNGQTRTILTEESVVIDVAEKVSPSVVTVGIKKTQRFIDPGSLFNNPFLDPYGLFYRQPQLREQEIERDIGSGFIVSSDGLVVTNKHVVDDSDAEYFVFTNDDQEYPVEKIDRDPLNDLAILKISASNLTPVDLGDSDTLKVGQFVIAIGTALGEFRHTVTTGVISGLGRGITAGDIFSQAAEELDNVIQTDAAINPGNSGGPLLNSAGQVIGINVAMAPSGENVGFALPINLIKEAIKTFNDRGGFDQRAFLGVRYEMVSMEAAVVNEIPEGAFIGEVVEGSPADKTGIQPRDIIVKFDNQALKDVDGGLAKLISGYKPGDQVELELWRDGDTQKLQVTLDKAE
jgi:S1-C subfamily serine protease